MTFVLWCVFTAVQLTLVALHHHHPHHVRPSDLRARVVWPAAETAECPDATAEFTVLPAAASSPEQSAVMADNISLVPAEVSDILEFTCVVDKINPVFLHF